MDTTTKEVLRILEILAEEEDMKVTAFGTTKGLVILTTCVLTGVTIIEPFAWGLFIGLFLGVIAASLICWDKKSVAEVIANMPRERQVRLVEQILKTGIALGQLTPRICQLSSMPQPRSRRRTKDSDEDSDEQKDQTTITLSDGKVVTRQDLVLALKQHLNKEGISVSK